MKTKFIQMENKRLFSEFQPVSSKQWKQQIQFDLKGADYNQALVWESAEGVKVKPFYNSDDTAHLNFEVKTKTSDFKILQNIFVHDVIKSNLRAKDVLKRGADSIVFIIENDAVDVSVLMKNLPLQNTLYYFNLQFISIDFVSKIIDFSKQNQTHFCIQIDPIHQFISRGNSLKSVQDDLALLKTFHGLIADFELNKSSNVSLKPCSGLYCNAKIYQNAGANIVQQLAFTVAHLNEYFNCITTTTNTVIIEIAVGGNYFFEIAKIRALLLLFHSLASQYHPDFKCHIVAIPSKRNKTIYDYNTNMLRTTTECMSAILGGADAISNLSYDHIYHKDNEFGDRIARNQLLILKQESYFDKVDNPSDGTYYIESLTHQLAEKALALFKEIEDKGGFLEQFVKGNIQNKINESAQKEQQLFDTGKEILVGTNKHPNKNDRMKGDLQLFPFQKQKPQKTATIAIIEKRWAEFSEQERLKLED